MRSCLAMLLIVYLVVLPLGVYAHPEEKPLVVCTTSVLYSIVRDIARDSVDVVMIVSPSICPAHYDVKPGDVHNIAKANLILYHGFEPWLESLVEASGTKAVLYRIKGPWNTPDALKERYRDVARALKDHLKLDVSDRLDQCLSKIDAVAAQLKKRAEEIGIKRIKVICMKWQKAFVSWLGLNIVAEYGPPEKLSAADVEELLKTGREEKVALVIDNLQSGVEFGRSLAERLDAVQVVLTNFPYTDPELVNLTEVMKRNANMIFDAVSKYEYMVTTLRLAREVDTWRTTALIALMVIIVETAIIAYLWRKLGA